MKPTSRSATSRWMRATSATPTTSHERHRRTPHARSTILCHGRKRPHEILDEKVAFARSFPVHVGVDCGKSFHKLVAMGPDGRRTKALRVDVSSESFEQADRFLQQQFPRVPRERMLVGIEFAGHHGFTFAHFLAGRGYQIVNVLPAVTKQLKEVEDNSPRKDDAKDAGQICRLLASGYFVGFPLLDEAAAQLRVLTTEYERLTREETRLKNRLHSALDLVWPEFAPQFCDLAKPTPVALLEQWPTPLDVLSELPEVVRELAVTVSRNHVKADRTDRLLLSAADSVGLTVGLDARSSELRRLLARWGLVREQLTEIAEELAALVAENTAATALTSVPGISTVCAATLVAELGTPERYASPRQVLKLAGMNLAGRESGTSVRGRVKQTKRGRPALRRQLFLLAGRWCQEQGPMRGYYEAMLTRNGGCRTKAVCAVARKMVPMLLKLMQTGQAFDLARWTAAHGVRHDDNPTALARSPYRAA